jgi:CHAT domain-containing protein
MHELYDLLIRPSVEVLHGAQTLIVVPDRVLQNVAFAALIDRHTNERLVERIAVVTAPRASSLQAGHRPAVPRSLLAVALPSGETAGSAALPDGEGEVREIGSRYRAARLMAPAEATFGAFSSAAPSADVIHIAGHTERKTADGTSFLFADGERVDWRAIAATSIARDAVVVLAGCETLRSDALPHRQTQTLGEAFLAAGSRAVVGTLVPISDRDARGFFAGFHRQLAAGAGEVEALRRTQLEWIGRGRVWQAVTLLTTRIPVQ